jgi:hypothetical protein
MKSKQFATAGRAFVDGFVEALTHAQRLTHRAQLEKKMAVEIAELFIAQKQSVMRAMRPFASWFDANALTESDGLTRDQWRALLAQSISGEQGEHDAMMAEIIEAYHAQAFVGGATIVIDQFGAGIVFSSGSPEAVRYATARAADQVTRINATTEKRLNRLIVQAVDEGWGWDRTAREIDARFDDFAGPPLFPSKKFTSRSQMIASYEIGDAYEAGSRTAIDIMRRELGWKFEKRWLNAGDSRVRPEHNANAADGYIDIDATFSGDGASRPPTDGGCRCTNVFRRIDKEAS